MKVGDKVKVHDSMFPSRDGQFAVIVGFIRNLIKVRFNDDAEYYYACKELDIIE